MSKTLVETEGPQMTSQYGAFALHAGKARRRARTRMHMPTQSRTRRPIYNTYWFCTATMIRERASVLLRCTYIACLVIYLFIYLFMVYSATMSVCMRRRYWTGSVAEGTHNGLIRRTLPAFSWRVEINSRICAPPSALPVTTDG